MPGPGTWVAGDILTAADLNAIGTWTTYTPVLDQNGTRTVTVNYAAYCKINDLCIVTVDLEITQAGSAGNTITVSLPVNMSGTVNTTSIGTGLFYDLSATDVILLTAISTGGSGSLVGFMTETGTSLVNFFGSNPSLAVASGDIISFTVAYPC